MFLLPANKINIQRKLRQTNINKLFNCVLKLGNGLITIMNQSLLECFPTGTYGLK